MSDSTATASAANTKMNHQSLINQSQVYYWLIQKEGSLKDIYLLKLRMTDMNILTLC